MVLNGHVAVRLFEYRGIPCEELPLDGRVKRLTNSRALVCRAGLVNEAILGRQWRC